ncbi:hypothetical protein BGZ70_000136 [Mortierella alpina]|uniref:F-box domain-containing protein n=1 Tax=Mortierella alpina TaxID=64518 RepID=A0A9P6IYU7_MORAP|nr:hypothetical protein BGZ70_000136 [Mortierella alpina]
MKLPEIRILIEQHLTKRDLVKCLQVCRSWYNLFIACIWESFQLDFRLIDGPQPRFIASYRHLIRSVAFFNIEERDLQDSGFPYPNLRSVSLHGRGRCFDGVFYASKSLLSLHPNVTHLNIVGVRVHHTAITELQHLKHLQLDDTRWSTDLPSFWTVCTRLESLVVDRSIFMTLPRPGRGITFPFLKSITLTRFIKFARLGKWPRLKELELQGTHVKILSEDLMTLLNSFKRNVEVLHVANSFLDMGAFELLRKSFTSLTELNLTHCRHVTDLMVREVMESCSNLTLLKASKVQARVMVEGKPWVCKSLQTLGLYFIFAPEGGSPADELTLRNELHTRVFERLSELRELETLVLGDTIEMWYQEWLGRLPQRGLELRLDRGLGRLSTLDRLRCLYIDKTWQLMEAKDYTWMLDHWPKLEVVDGRVNIDDWKISSDFQSALRKKNEREYRRR